MAPMVLSSGWGWRMDGVDEIEEAEAGLLAEEQSCRMKDSNC